MSQKEWKLSSSSLQLYIKEPVEAIRDNATAVKSSLKQLTVYLELQTAAIRRNTYSLRECLGGGYLA